MEEACLRDPTPLLKGLATALSSWLQRELIEKTLPTTSKIMPVVGISAKSIIGLLLVLLLLVIAAAWFIIFGLVLLFSCCYYCCCRRRIDSYSRVAYALSLVFLILFTLSAIIGCIVLYNGQGKFHSSTSDTLDFVVGQANITVQKLRNFSDDLSAAKKVGVDQVFLPANVQAQIDELVTKVNSSANSLDQRSSDNSKKIKDLLETVRLVLIVVAAVMLFLAFLGFLFSIFGLQFLVYMLVLVGWILVAGTFILCGIFLVLHNVVEDTCVSMDEWVIHPSAHTALDDILPCVDVATANESLTRSREVTYQLANIVNQVINGVSNRNFPPGSQPLYYNQSGPLMPALCNPYNADLTDRTCASGQVDFNNASRVWQGYVCNVRVVSGSEICTTVGRLTPTIYKQMSAAVRVSFGLYRYGPFLVQLQDCTFVRQTFSAIDENNCSGLGKYSRWVYVGLAMVSDAIPQNLQICTFECDMQSNKGELNIRKAAEDITTEDSKYQTTEDSKYQITEDSKYHA